MSHGVHHDSRWVRFAFLLAAHERVISRWSQNQANWETAQVYAEVVGGLSALTAILYLIPFILRFAFVWIWNLVLFILWIALFGVFGKVCDMNRPEAQLI
jgi:hypothetical protein